MGVRQALGADQKRCGMAGGGNGPASSTTLMSSSLHSHVTLLEWCDEFRLSNLMAGGGDGPHGDDERGSEQHAAPGAAQAGKPYTRIPKLLLLLDYSRPRVE